ncbi:MAG: DEAD/DEAH box helicase [Nanoarchaeota archaeon]|nr:DEAD/DEAH box helicase [Nanoarchaeota archaeon]
MKQKLTFKTMLSPELHRVLTSMGIKEPTPIQEESFSLIKQNNDVICQSSTGSGKTLAFAMPLSEMINNNDKLVALILVPTRELCEQVSEEFKKITKHKKLNVVEVYGGVSIENQIRKVPHAHIVVATPGRLCDLIDRKAINLKTIKKVVLDEADRMLDMGFVNDVEYILEQTPKGRQTLMFSATIQKEIDYLIKRHMREPKKIKIKEHVDKSLLKQYFYIVNPRERFDLLVYLLKEEKAPYAIVFCGTRRTVDLVAHNLKNNGLEAHAIHGGLTQNRRKKVMTSFHGKSTHILVASDIAARGIDIQMLSHVYNYDVPKTSQDYVHRIGRTARAGHEGVAVTIVTDKDFDSFRNVQRDKTLDIMELRPPKLPRTNYNKFLPRQQNVHPQSRRNLHRSHRSRHHN